MNNWKEIEGFEGLYEVSDNGQVRSLKNNRKKDRTFPLILEPCVIGHKPNNCYLSVNLYKDGKPTSKSIHKLVAKAFITNPLDLPLVNHKDEITFNNDVSNLEWCTHQYNQEYSLSKKIYHFVKDGKEFHVKNLRKFSRENNLNHGHMYQVAKGNLPSYKGFKKLVTVV